MKRGASFFLATLRTIIYIFLSTIETIATTLIFLGLCCVNRSTFLPHFSTTPIHFHNSSTINRLFLQSYFTSSRINSGCGSCGHCFLPKLYTLFPATISSPVLNQAKQAPSSGQSGGEALYLLQQLKHSSRTHGAQSYLSAPLQQLPFTALSLRA